MLPLFARIKTWWTTADRSQRVVTLGGLGALLLLLVGTAFFVTRPHYQVLMENLSETDKGGIVDALGTLGIPAQYGRPGVVEVPAERVAEARMKLATAGKMPKGSNHWGLSEMGKAGPFTSPDVESQTLKAVLEGEIASTLETMDGVASAQVLITAPKTSVFSDDKQAPTASVTIVEDGRGVLTPANGRTIANLVCSAVDGMSPDGVVVVSNALGELWNGKNAETSTTKSDLDNKVARDWESKIQSALDVPFGPGNTKVIVRADVDVAKRRTREHQVEPTASPTATLKEQEKMDGGRKTASGVAGASSNTADKALAAPPDEGGGKGVYDKKGEQKEFDVSTVDRDTDDGAGDLKGLAITVIANQDKIAEPAKVKEIVDGVMGGKILTDASGVAKPNQPFSTTVTSVKFDGSAAAAAKEAADKLAGQQRMQQVASLLPIAAILVVALLVAKQVGRISRAVLPAAAMADGDLAESPEALEMPEGVSALPAASGSEIEEPSRMLEPIRDRVDVPLETLKQMAVERPEMVATLIKSVMLGERS